jgi:flagellar basal-body rod modification protein FlgD
MAISNVDFAGLGLSPTQDEPDAELGQEEFLKLMITQLENQDPFKPLESGEFLGQLAQFGTVSGLSGLQTAFDGLATSLVSNQALQAAALVGRSVLVEGGEGFVASAGEGLSGAVALETSSPAVQVQIRDASGQLVRTLDMGTQPAGLARFTWDGTDGSGNAAPEGRYTVSAQYASDSDVEAASTFVDGHVQSVSFGANGLAVQLRGLDQVPFSAVREIG